MWHQFRFLHWLLIKNHNSILKILLKLQDNVFCLVFLLWSTLQCGICSSNCLHFGSGFQDGKMPRFVRCHSKLVFIRSFIHTWAIAFASFWHCRHLQGKQRHVPCFDTADRLQSCGHALTKSLKHPPGATSVEVSRTMSALVFDKIMWATSSALNLDNICWIIQWHYLPSNKNQWGTNMSRLLCL